jgi:hypothetical protein
VDISYSKCWLCPWPLQLYNVKFNTQSDTKDQRRVNIAKRIVVTFQPFTDCSKSQTSFFRSAGNLIESFKSVFFYIGMVYSLFLYWKGIAFIILYWKTQRCVKANYIEMCNELMRGSHWVFKGPIEILFLEFTEVCITSTPAAIELTCSSWYHTRLARRHYQSKRIDDEWELIVNRK